MKFHLISGLPRSGSTLLAAILKQNPRFTAGMSSPVASLYAALESAMAQRNEGAVFVTDEQRKVILRSVFENFYSDTATGYYHGCNHSAAGRVVFDTNRGWTAKMPALAQLYPDAKVICCVRDLAWIMDSFERLHARNPFEPSGIYGFQPGTTIYGRCGMLGGGSGVVGHALDGLREACAGEFKDRLLLVEYEDLCKTPAEVLARIYAFIGEETFAHDFNSVEYSASEFDRNLGARGLHDVKGAVEWRERKTILPPDLFSRYADDQFWRAA